MGIILVFVAFVTGDAMAAKSKKIEWKGPGPIRFSFQQSEAQYSFKTKYSKSSVKRTSCTKPIFEPFARKLESFCSNPTFRRTGRNPAFYETHEVACSGKPIALNVPVIAMSSVEDAWTSWETKRVMARKKCGKSQVP